METNTAENKTYQPLVLNEEQLLLKTSARDYLKANAPISQLRTLRDSKDPIGYSPKVWEDMAQTGWTSLIIPEKYDGLAFGFVGLGLVLEETGRTLTASPLFSTALIGVSALLLGGTEAHKSTFLPPIADGKLLTALALEEGIYHNPSKIELTATENAQGFVLKGTKKFVVDGHVANRLIVVAKTSNGVTLFFVDAKLAGITVQKSDVVDSRNVSTVQFDNVQVSKDDILGTLNQGAALVDKILDLANVGLAAEMLGMMQEAFDRTVAYLKQRHQFGVPIGSFQGLQHRAADMFCEIEMCKSVVLKALIAVEQNDPELSKFASLAKAKTCDVLKRVSNESIQMFGGIGMTDDEEIGFFLKRARAAQQTFGDYHYHLNRMAVIQGY